MPNTLKRRIIKGLFWSMAQSWGGRAISFLLFMLLARILSPQQFGLVASATIVLSLMEVLYEQGFGDALVQKPDLKQEDLNSVFYISLTISFLLIAFISAAADQIAVVMKVPNIQWVLIVASFGLPVASAGICQQAMYRKNLEYRWLAVRTLVATCLSGCFGLILALRGFGAWSLVAQGLSATALNTAILWTKPLFRPTLTFNWQSFRRLWTYSINAFGNRLLDFGNTRIIELLIVVRYGAGALGIFVVGSKIYQMLMQVLSSVVLDVAHSGFSQIALDRSRLLDAYYKSLEFTAAVAMPCFIMLAAISTEITQIFFGNKWGGAASVMHALCWLGALQCVQFYNATCFNAIGRPSLTLLINILKIVLTVAALSLSKAEGIAGLSASYVIAVSLVAPLSFWLAWRYLGVSMRRLASILFPFVVASLSSYATVLLSSGYLRESIMTPILHLTIEIFIAVTIYVLLCLVLAPQRVKYVLNSLREARKHLRPETAVLDADLLEGNT